MNARLVRKSFITTVRKRDPSMKGSLAVFLCHSEKAQEGSYFIPDKMEICSKTATRMRAMMRASNDDNNNQETEKKCQKFQRIEYWVILKTDLRKTRQIIYHSKR